MALKSSDLSTVLAVARGGSLSAAARTLGVNHSTISRRLAALEAETGQTLFRRLRRGYVATGAGEKLIEAAERMEEELRGLERLLSGRDIRLSGALRITAPDDIANHLLLEPLARFRAAYPGIVVTQVIENRLLSLGRREADVALRATNRPQASLVGRRVAGLAATLYGSRALLAGRAVPAAGLAETGDLPWIGWEDDGAANNLKAWIETRAPEGGIAYRANSVANHFAAVRAGLGLGVLPCYLGDVPDLVRVLPPQPSLEAGLWILTHPDLRQAARVAALTEFLFAELKRQEPLLAGRGPAGDLDPEAAG